MPSPTRKREVGRGERVAPGRLAPAPAAAVARRPALQRLGAGRRRRHRPGRHAACTSRARSATSSARWRRSTCELEHVRLLVCTHAHSDHYGQAATIVERAGLRAVDAPQPRAHDARARTDPDARAGAPASRSRARAACPSEPLRALRRGAQAARATASPRLVEPDRDLVAGVEIETDLGALDASTRRPGHAPSHVCLLPARAPPADLRRPPARPRLALLRLRLHARPGRRVPALARRRRGARRAPVPARPRPHVHRRARRTSTPTARSSRERIAQGARRRRRARPADRLRRGPARLRRADHADERELVAVARRSATCTHLERRRAASSASRATSGGARALDRCTLC